MIEEIRRRLVDSDLSPQDLRIVLAILNEVEKAQEKRDGEPEG